MELKRYVEPALAITVFSAPLLKAKTKASAINLRLLRTACWIASQKRQRVLAMAPVNDPGSGIRVRRHYKIGGKALPLF
jgi:hypothetical protein